MPTSIDASQLQACLKALYRLQTVEEFIVTMMREIPKLVASDHTSYNEINVTQPRLIGVMDTPAGQMIADRHRAIYERHLADNPLVGHFRTPGHEAVAKVSDYMSDDDWRATELYRKFYARFGDVYQMVISVPTPGDSFIGIGLHRLGRDFTEEDRDTLLFLHPYLGQAYANAVEHTRTLGLLDVHNRALNWLDKGVVEVDQHLQATYISPLAEHYLDEFFPDRGQHKHDLPAPLQEWLQSIPGDRQAAVCRPFTYERDIGQVTVSLVPSRVQDEAEGMTLLVDCTLPGDGSRSLQELGLSEREADVLFWLAQGKSNPEVAIILGITAPTVKKHLEAIFRKLGVSNRTEAALRAHRFLTQG